MCRHEIYANSKLIIKYNFYVLKPINVGLFCRKSINVELLLYSLTVFFLCFFVLFKTKIYCFDQTIFKTIYMYILLFRSSSVRENARA